MSRNRNEINPGDPFGVFGRSAETEPGYQAVPIDFADPEALGLVWNGAWFELPAAGIPPDHGAFISASETQFDTDAAGCEWDADLGIIELKGGGATPVEPPPNSDPPKSPSTPDSASAPGEAAPATGPPNIAAERSEPAQWDDEPSAPRPISRVEWAVEMARRGLHILRLAEGDQAPAAMWKQDGSREEDKPTRDEARIREMFRQYPDMNYACVPLDGFAIVDVDTRKNGEATLAALPFALPESTFTVKTPGLGAHLYYKTDTPIRGGTDRLGKGVDVQADTRYVVGPGSRFTDPHGKKGYTGDYIVTCDAPIAAAPESLKLACGEMRNERNRDRTPVSVDDPDDIVFAIHYLEKDAPPAVEGRGGNNTTYAVAARLIEIGVSGERAAELMAEHWNDRCSPPWDVAELAVICGNAANYALARQGSGGVSALRDEVGAPVTLPAPSIDRVSDDMPFEDFLKQFPSLGSPIAAGQSRPAVPWLVKKVLPRRGVGVLYGPSTAGKSYLVLDLARKLWRGEDFFGAKIKERKATVIFAFEGADFMGFRLDAIKVAHNGDDPAIMVIPAGRMSVNGLKSIVPALKRIAKEMKRATGLAVGLVVIDTVSSAGLAEDEDKAKDVAPALKAVAEFAAAVDAFGLLVHHPNKGGTLRGSGAWFNNSDVVIRVEQDSGGSVREIEGEKIKDAPKRVLGHFELEEVKLGKDEDGEPITACIVVPSCRPTPQAVGGHKHFDRFILAFEEAASKRGTTYKGRPMAAIAEVQELFKDSVAHDYESAAGVRGAWKKCRDQAEEAGIVKSVPGERNVYFLTEAAVAIEDPNAVAAVFAGSRAN